MAVKISVRTFTLVLNGAEIGTAHTPTELVGIIVANMGKGYRGLAQKLSDALYEGKDTSFMERILGVEVRKGFAAIAA